MNDYTVVITYHDSVAEHKDRLEANFKKQGINYMLKNGGGVQSFSKLMNEAIYECPTEICIIANYKLAYANKEHVDKLVDLIKYGYGIASLCNIRFFGYKKDLFRKIGFWDERFIGGQCEDGDIQRRIKWNDIAHYETNELPFYNLVSSWQGRDATSFFYQKYKYVNNKAVKVWRESTWYDLGDYQMSNFLSFDKSYFNGVPTEQVLLDTIVGDARWVRV